MSEQLFRETHVPLPRRVRFKRAVYGFFSHPIVQMVIVTFWVVCIVTVITVAVTRGWL
jgi:hypothetical protein